jgi:hypothetical protein
VPFLRVASLLACKRSARERLLIVAEWTRINDLFRRGKLQDEERRRIERELDLREALISPINCHGYVAPREFDT